MTDMWALKLLLKLIHINIQDLLNHSLIFCFILPAQNLFYSMDTRCSRCQAKLNGPSAFEQIATLIFPH